MAARELRPPSRLDLLEVASDLVPKKARQGVARGGLDPPPALLSGTSRVRHRSLKCNNIPAGKPKLALKTEGEGFEPSSEV